MTGGFLTVSIMRPTLRLAILHVSILAGLLLTLNADSEDYEDSDSDCSPGIKVRRNTVYKATLGEDLMIDCPVTFCNNSPPIVWYKVEKNGAPVNVNRSAHIKTEWKPTNYVEGISVLIFYNIQINDSGQYRCQSGADVGHGINVFVYDNGEILKDLVMNKTNNISDSISPPSGDDMFMYVYSAAGIVAFVILVIIISIISMLGCKGKPKKETSNENQYMAIPMMEPAFPHAGLQSSPRESPSVPPSRRSTRKKTTPSQRNEPTSPEDHLYGVIKEDNETQRNVVQEEGSSVVYAALNHQMPLAAPVRPRIEMEERSEYAAIRVP